MFELRFVIKNRQRLAHVEREDRGYLAGLDLSPWSSSRSIEGEVLTLRYEESDSPRLFQRVLTSKGNELTLATATLQARAKPYILWLELARGTVDRMRNRISAWQVIGFTPSDELASAVSQCSLDFCRSLSAVEDVEACENLAMAAIDRTLATIRTAVREYLKWMRSQTAEQASVPKTLRATWLHSRFVEDVLQRQLLGELVNTVSISANWREIQPSPEEWNWEELDRLLEVGNLHQWNVVLGPILKFERSAIPDWVLDFGNDFAEVRRAVSAYVRRLLDRYSNQVDLCLLAQSANLPGDTGWEGAARLQAVIDAATQLRQVIDNLPFVIGIAQPFGESQGRGGDYPSLQLADAMLRANIDLSGFALEFEFGAGEGETWPRDLCQLTDRLSQWSMFGLPLVVCTSQPNCLQASESSSAKADTLLQQEDYALWLELLDASPLVHAVFWTQPYDHETACRGLLSKEGRRTSAAEWFSQGFGLESVEDTHPGS